MTTHLDNFRRYYTINYTGERDSRNFPISNNNFFKIAMWVPVVSYLFSIIVLKAAYEGLTSDDPYKRLTKSEVATYISRAVFGIVLPPLLIIIDLVGTLVKLVIDAMNKNKKPAAILLPA